MNDWYDTLERPALTPPDWVFGPVWSVLYVMIAVAIVHYIIRTRRERPYAVYALIALHLTTNACWTPLFFGLQRPGLALLDIIALDLTLVALVYLFWKADRLASTLLWPYLGWVLFATWLNAGFYLLNRG